MSWWHGRRNQRRVVPGGRPVNPAPHGTPTAQVPTAQVKPFVPTPVNEAAVRDKIDEAVTGLMPDGVDEATDKPLDNLINAYADQWLSDLTVQHARYTADLRTAQKMAEATLGSAKILAGRDRSILSHKVLALESALLRMVRTEWPGRRRRHEPDAGQPYGYQPPGPPEEVPGKTAASGPGEASRDAEPSDLRILLGPRERRWYALWRDSGHGDPPMLAGRPRSAYLHVVALLAAAGADIGAFSQIVQLVLPNQGNLLVLVVVVGFTATVLYLAHACGMMLRDRVAGADWLRSSAIYFCAAIWLALGVAALVIRLRFQPVAGTLPGFSVNGPSAVIPASPADKLYPAIVFFALYIATGLVAGVGAYLTHNPLRAAYVSAARGYRQAAEESAVTAYQAGVAEAQRYAYEAQLKAADETLFNESEKRLALAAELKQYARVKMAQRLQDPAVTDAIFKEDWRPYP